MGVDVCVCVVDLWMAGLKKKKKDDTKIKSRSEEKNFPAKPAKHNSTNEYEQQEKKRK